MKKTSILILLVIALVVIHLFLARGGKFGGSDDQAETLNAKAHREILCNPWLEQALDLARQTGGISVCRAHSGTILGLLYSKTVWDEKTVAAYLRKHLPAQICLHVAELTGGSPMACDFATSSEVEQQ